MVMRSFGCAVGCGWCGGCYLKFSLFRGDLVFCSSNRDGS